ncbi:MAG: sorbosone dehydrogenase family protein, partial [Gammaproteobacteria bacterium]
MKRASIIGLLSVLCLPSPANAGSTIDTAALRLPPGFRIEVLVAEVPNARSMALSDQGTLFVGTRRNGNVYAIRNVFGERPEILTIATGRRT